MNVSNGGVSKGKDGGEKKEWRKANGGKMSGLETREEPETWEGKRQGSVQWRGAREKKKSQTGGISKTGRKKDNYKENLPKKKNIKRFSVYSDMVYVGQRTLLRHGPGSPLPRPAPPRHTYTPSVPPRPDSAAPPPRPRTPAGGTRAAGREPPRRAGRSRPRSSKA